MNFAGEKIKSVRIRRHSFLFITFLFKSVRFSIQFKNSINLNILKEKNFNSSLFLCIFFYNPKNNYGMTGGNNGGSKNYDNQ